MRLGSRDERVAVDAAGDAGDLDRVVDDLRAERQALPGLVERRRERPVHVEVARLDRQVRRLERAAALLVDDVERADDPDVVLEVREVAGPPAAIDVGDERRPADRAEDQVAIAEDEVPLRVPGVELEARRRRARSAPRPARGRGGPARPRRGPRRRRPRARRSRRPARRGRAPARSRTSTPTSRRIRSPARWIASTWSALRISIGANGLTIRRHGSRGMPPPVRRSRRGRARRSSGLSGTGPR